MIYIQRVRSNDIGADYGKQVEFGKVFMANHKWKVGTIPVTITFSAISSEQEALNGTKLTTSFKVRGDERGGDRIGIDCKEYANEVGICVLKQFLTDQLHLKPGEDYFILEDVGNDGRTFKLYAIQGDTVPASTLLNKFKGQFIDIESNGRAIVSLNPPKSISKTQSQIITAMRTKPFLLLAGISGTGKSRIVKQMAFDSCPDNRVLRSDLTSPGNYCLIEVKPNWHDSTELIGYESQIGKPHYQLTPFVKFLAKAMLHPTAPFFVCLDEMNLAPVEQYFAEFLSVLESRTKIDGHIVSEPLIKADVFKKFNLKKELFSHEIEKTTYDDAFLTVEPEVDYGKEAEVYEQLREQGLRIPSNVIVIGTVNMDETTHQFSRKVIDRAMTIEMNLPDGDPFMDFFNNASELEYRANPTSPSLYLATETKASDVVEVLAADNADKTEWLKVEVADVLTKLNTALDGTPFKVAYRVQNELMLYFYQIWLEDKAANWEDLLATATGQILMMKVLPRVEGDEDLLEKPLSRLADFCVNYPNAKKKVEEMQKRLEHSQFTSYWP